MKTFMFAVVAMLTIAFVVPNQHVLAQGTDTNTYYNDTNGASGTTEDGTMYGTDTDNAAVGGSAGTTANDSAFDSDNDNRWLWLLPLLAIPIIYFVWKGSKKDDDRNRTNARPATDFSR